MKGGALLMTHVELKWLKSPPAAKGGVTWGVPWEKGVLQKEEQLSIAAPGGSAPVLQSRPLAYWPDGSVKWTGHAAVFEGRCADRFVLQKGGQKAPERILQVAEAENGITVNTGLLVCRFNKTGSPLISSISVSGETFGAGRLMAFKERRSGTPSEKVYRIERFEGVIKGAAVEQNGPVKTVIKTEGVHCGSSGNEWLPFIIRFIFYAGSASIRIMHTILIDCDAKHEWVKGLGFEFSAKFSGAPWNRHIRFVADSGIYGEAAQLLLTRRFGEANGIYEKQIAGELVTENADTSAVIRDASTNAVWNDYKFIHDSPSHYRLQKRTDEDCAWVSAIHGKRAKGLMYAGGENGGMALGLKNFFEKYPSSLEVSGLGSSETKMTAWFWPPEAEAMDFRHYSKSTHVESAYEGFAEMRSTAVGIANTSEANIAFFTKPPSGEELTILADEWQHPPLLVCEPDYYYKTRALGVWSAIDTSHPFKAKLEEQLDAAFCFYKNEVDQRGWYGFWHFGDVMHTYDRVRHVWRYDIGGYAWQNTELVPNLWLWQMFFRSGREDVFRMAEAMTRHTSEVDCYHFGEYKGLGSRHNVVHWGCGCKEARISMAGLHKAYYFLTADERTGDILTEVKDADQALKTLDPMRAYYPNGTATHARVGPDWAAFCSNWLTEWERTGDQAYLAKIQKGIAQLKTLPLRLLSGPSFEYDPASAKLIHIGDGNEGGYHMVIAFGAPQVWMELAGLLEDEEWCDMLAEFGECYVLSDEEKRSMTGGTLHDGLFHWPMFSAAMVAYAARRRNDRKLAEKAWRLLLDETKSHTPLPIAVRKTNTWDALYEIPWVTTNCISQWCLNTIAVLELLGDMLPESGLQEKIMPANKGQKECKK
ncbi:hypothetical protein COP00_23820 [Bacillus glycinifermentans]|uniref:Uncharacterized protein n=2 Tax=Bacillus glycinifermentans TaxID=1664069 RepID=A0A0T6BL93_9BACI|nr:hypothetical protein COP00_23820 [Bacillus glycinifermentans]KRT91384.1 hypothetical protein AB447_223305 [Bacillus glycinifermentans]